MRLIDADVLYELIDNGWDIDFSEVPETKAALLEMINQQDTVDAIPAVRGRDCKYAYESSPGLLYCHHPNCERHLYCAADELHICGERKVIKNDNT